MLLYRRSLIAGVCSLLLLSGCGFSSNGTSFGSSGSPSGAGGGGSNTGGGAPIGPIGGGGPAGSTDVIVATPSDGAVSVAVGAAQTVSITFTSNDGNAISGFAVSGTLATLPAGWSGPGNFTCASVSTGSGCVLNLTYAPTAADSGTLIINYVFIDNATTPNTGGSVTIAYAATTHNNVIAAASPTGQINGVVGGGNQSVSVSFTTDDGNAATGLTLTTSLTALPPGWSSTVPGFSCAIVSTGSGCQLPLTFTPTAGAGGTLALTYGYTDDSGTARTGTLNIPYSTVAHNSVVATASPPGEIVAVETGSQAVAVTFNTDDGNPASALYLTSDLTALPAGWSSASKTLSCSSVSTGNGCQLQLTYAPTALTSGTLTLNYAYTDAAGTASTGSLNVAYAATTNDNAVATVSPTGQIDAVLGQGASAVSVTFTTDDGRPATALQLTSSLAGLPAGWSSTSPTFSCGGFSSGNACQLALMYAPTSPGSGTLVLNYAYLNNAGEPKTGSVSVAYRATANNTVNGTPSQTSLAVVTGSITPITVNFTTDDGNPATGLSVTSGLSTLPNGWSSTPGSFTCSSVSAGTACQLSLTYAPTVPTVLASNTLSLTYGYNNNSGTPETGTVSISYVATQAYLYIAQLGLLTPPGSPSVSYCMLTALGTPTNCVQTATTVTFNMPTGIAFNGSGQAYVADEGAGIVYVCNVMATGDLSGCNPGATLTNPFYLAVNGSTLYVTSGNGTGGLTICAIGSGGALSNSNCAQSPAESAGIGTSGIAVSSSYAYVGVGPNSVDDCTVGSMGSLTHCTPTGAGFSDVGGIALAGGYAYIANTTGTTGGTVSVCSINAAAAGTLSCGPTSSVGGAPVDIAINGSYAYVDDFVTGAIDLCSVVTGGALTGCIPTGSTTFSTPVQIAIH
jgi:hypothetical protein